MTQIDVMLAKLHAISPPKEIASLDGAALAAEARNRAAIIRKSGAATAVTALILGVAGSALPAAAVEASITMPLGAVSPLAPSTLLAN